jgi:hypothetical protein
MSLDIGNVILGLWERRKKERCPDLLKDAELDIVHKYEQQQVWQFQVRSPKYKHGLSFAGWEIGYTAALFVVSGAYVNWDCIDKGVGKCLADLRAQGFQEYRRLDEYPKEYTPEVICRVAPSNVKQHHILEKVGWKQLPGTTLWRLPV